MNCQQARALEHAYADAELDAMRMKEIEDHLATCEACAKTYEKNRALKSVLHVNDLYYSAPAALKQQLRAALPTSTPRPTLAAQPQPTRLPPHWWFWSKLGLGTAGVALLAFVLVAKFGAPSPEGRLVQELTSSHVRSLMASHITDVASSDQHTVKPWFTGKLDFSPRVIDLAARGFSLVGGRLDYLENRPVAALVYQRRKHVINLFTWPTTSGGEETREQTTVRNGYNLVHWTQAGMTYWALSDLNRAELLDFVHALRSSP